MRNIIKDRYILVCDEKKCFKVITAFNPNDIKPSDFRNSLKDKKYDCCVYATQDRINKFIELGFVEVETVSYAILNPISRTFRTTHIEMDNFNELKFKYHMILDVDIRDITLDSELDKLALEGYRQGGVI